MKKSNFFGILCLCLSSSTFATLEQADTHLQNGQFKQAQSLLLKATKDKTQAVEAWQKLTQLALQQQDYDDAEEYIEKAVDLAPDNAHSHYFKGQVMAAQAQNASIFSAPGYAKKSLKAFERAVELAPDSIEYRSSLMGFYLNAPGIVGGDNQKGLAQAQAIQKLDEKQGLLALVQAYTVLEDENRLEQTYQLIEQKHADDPKLSFQRGIHLQNTGQWQPAMDIFTRLSQAQTSEDNREIKFNAMYQLGKTCGLSKTNQQAGIASLTNYIEQAPNHGQLPPKEWAEFRMALLLDQTGKRKEARNIYRKLKSSTSDKQLLKQVKRQL